MKSIQIKFTSGDPIAFVGRYLPKRQQPNWHYYETQDGAILHVRKEHMVMVIEYDNNTEKAG